MAKLVDLKLPPSARKRFSFTRKTRDGGEVQCECLLQVLTPKHADLARAEALRHVKKLIELSAEKDEKLAGTFDELLYDARLFETLQYALRDPEHEALDEPPPWATAMELRETLTTLEAAQLWRAYETHVDWLGPVKHELTEAQYEAMLMISAANDKLDPEELYGARLRAKCHHKMAEEILALRAAVSEMTKTIDKQTAAPDFNEILADEDVPDSPEETDAE